MLSLAHGPGRRITCYPCCNVNGFRFHTMDCDETSTTQNCGVLVRREHENENISYYELIKDIVELSYIEGNKVALFDCN